jgi:hypothetical protein
VSSSQQVGSLREDFEKKTAAIQAELAECKQKLEAVTASQGVIVQQLGEALETQRQVLGQQLYVDITHELKAHCDTLVEWLQGSW